MMVRKYDKEDWEEVSTWFQARKLNVSEENLPKHGFIVPGVAAGFLYGTDSSFCVFETFVSNPEVHRNNRVEGLGMIVDELIKEAKRLKYKQVFGFASNKTMLEIGYHKGFKFVELCSTIVRHL